MARSSQVQVLSSGIFRPACFSSSGIDPDGEERDADRRTDQGAADFAGVEHLGVHRRKVEHGGLGAQVEQGIAAAVRGDVGLIHLDDVGRGVGRGLGGQLVPIAAELAVLHLDRDAGVGLLECGHRFLGQLQPRVVAPRGDSQRRPPPESLSLLRLWPGAHAVAARRQTSKRSAVSNRGRLGNAARSVLAVALLSADASA